MGKKLLVEEHDKTQAVKDITIVSDPQKLKMILNKLSWQILVRLSEKEMYPLEIARKMGIHEQKVYYHIRKLVKAGAITVSKQEEKKGAIAKYFKPTSSAFGIELPLAYRTVHKSFGNMDRKTHEFFGEFIDKTGTFNGKIIVGSPLPHGPFRTSARDGHYASYLTFFLGQYMRVPDEFAVKLDVDVKAEKEEKNNLILVGGPGTNLLTQEANEFLPIRFSMQPSKEGFLFGGLTSRNTSQVYTADAVGLVAKIVNPWDKTKRVIILAGNKAVGTKACVLAITTFLQKTLKNYDGDDTFARVIQGLDLNGDGKVDSVDVLE